MHGTPNDIWYGTSGPRNAEIVLVGEAWGAAEDAAKSPFCGGSGQELNRLLQESSLSRDEIFCTNVIPARPYGNEMWRFFNRPAERTGFPSGASIRATKSTPDFERCMHRSQPFVRS